MSVSEDLLMQNLGEIKEAVKGIADTNKNIEANLKSLNDHNILHNAESIRKYEEVTKGLNMLTSRWFWLFITILMILLTVLGVKEAAELFAVVP